MVVTVEPYQEFKEQRVTCPCCGYAFSVPLGEQVIHIPYSPPKKPPRRPMNRFERRRARAIEKRKSR